MRVLVVYASHYGATREIAERIAEVLRGERLSVELRSADEDFTGLTREDFDAFVIGSAIHAGHWLRPAVDFVHHNARVLSVRPAWLFSSGPIGQAAVDKIQPDPRDIKEFRHLLDVQEHVIFGGSFDPAKADLEDTGWLEREVVRRLLPVGDFRDWEQIETWARQVALELNGVIVS